MYQPKPRLIFSTAASQAALARRCLGHAPYSSILDETMQLSCGHWELLPEGLARKGFKYRVA